MMAYYIECPDCLTTLGNANKTTLEDQFVAHTAGHGWTAAKAQAYFPANCWEGPVVARPAKVSG
jgi:hypothetical protein